jgi:hypothetical protein
VPELIETRAAVASVFASSDALDRLAPAGAYACRVAPDEAMFVREPAAAEALLRDAGAVTAGDPDAVVVDATDGWAVWTLAGEDAREAFTRLSHVELPVGGYTHGEVLRLPVRIVAGSSAVHLFVPSMWRTYLRDKILARCRDLDLAENPQAADWNGARR